MRDFAVMLVSRQGATALVVLGWTASAAAQDSFSYEARSERPARATPPRDEIDPAPQTDTESAALPPVQRSFSYIVDPTLPHPLHALASYTAGYASSEGATRPLAATKGRGGLVNELRLEAGAHERLSGFVTGVLAPPVDGETSAQSAFDAGARLLLTDPRSRSVRLALDAIYLRDFDEVSAAALRTTVSVDVDRVRLASMVHGEKAFASDRDAVDVYAALGASVRVVDELRGGVEYVGQDLEDAWEDEEAEGGVRHFAGATVAWAWEERVLVTAGPAVGLSAAAPDFLGRASVAYAF